jgi:cell division septal protein FtsQ
MTPRRPAVDADPGARRALARRRRRRKIRLGIAWGILGSLAAGAAIGLKVSGDASLVWVRRHTSLFEVRRVDPGETQWVSPWELVDASGVSPGDDLFDVAPGEVAARITERPRVASAVVDRTWKRTVRISVVEKPPVALWVGETAMEVAADGTILGPPPAGARPEWPAAAQKGWTPRGVELPLLTGIEARLEPGDMLEDAGARNALAFLARLSAYGMDGGGWVSEIWAGTGDQMVLVTLEGGTSVRIGDGRLSKRKLTALRTVLDRLHRKAETVDFVDARFRYQVVVRSS